MFVIILKFNDKFSDGLHIYSILYMWLQEQFYIMKPEEVIVRSFYLYPTADQAGKYECAGKLQQEWKIKNSTSATIFAFTCYIQMLIL